MKMRLYITIRVDVETSLTNVMDTIDELQTYTDYEIGSTGNVKVLETELVTCDTIY